jgi:hypothetical protein
MELCPNKIAERRGWESKEVIIHLHEIQEYPQKVLRLNLKIRLCPGKKEKVER